MIEKIKYHFDASHRLSNYEGACNNLHGHRWEVEVTIVGEPDINTGMIIDFKEIKKIIDGYDHSCIIFDNKKNHLIIEALVKTGLKVNLLRNEPTAENLVKELYNSIALSDKLAYQKLKIELWESPGCSVVYGDDI